MPYLIFLLPFFSLLYSISASSPLTFTAIIHHFPPSSPTPLPLATLSYNPLQPDLSTVLSFTPLRAPASPNSPELTRVAIILPSSNSDSDSDSTAPHYRTTLTSLASFHAPYKGRFRLVVTRSGEVLGASWHAAALSWAPGDGASISGESAGSDRKGDFDLLVQKEGPKPVLEKIVVKGQPVVGEDGEEVVEKTLLQKYWWVLAGVAFLALSGGSGDN